MIAADHDRRLELALAHHFVEREPESMPLPVAQPADACRQSLELDACVGMIEPANEVLLLRKELACLGIGACDVLGVTRERYPAKRSHALTEQRPDVERHESLEIERIADAGIARHGADVVAIIERGNPAFMETEHRPHLLRH